MKGRKVGKTMQGRKRGVTKERKVGGESNGREDE